MHDELFRNQPEWNGEATDNPKKIFLGYVKALGMNSDTWEKCYDEQQHQSRILANQAEGNRRKVQSTPTFVIGTRMIPGSMSYDVFKAYVDSATKEAPAAAKATRARSVDEGHRTEEHHEVTRRQLLVLLAVVGCCIALYLTLYKVGVIGVLSCSIGSCETVNTSKWSMLLGIPIAAWGLAAYLALLVLAMVGSAESREDERADREAARRARRVERALLGVAHVSRALRHPRDLHLVRVVGRAVGGDPRACASRTCAR